MIAAIRSAWNSAGLGGLKAMTPKSAFWLGLLFPLVIFISAHRAYYFTAAVEESGDYGANALQIENAKRCSEILGNYSRFHFNHPGPAFFYVYAGAETLLHDWIPVTRSPATAHSLGGLLLQSIFFAAAISIFARFFPRRQTVILAIVACCIHFVGTGMAFAAIWPPYQLVMPYWCFLVAAAAVMAGATNVLPILVTAVCFCVHGHVAQAVFVLPSFVLAVGWAWRLEYRAALDSGPGAAMKQSSRRMFWNRGGLVSVLITALFVLPLALDALKGPRSNFALILNYVRHSHAASKPLSDSVVFYLSFLRYWHGLGDLPRGTIAANLRHYPLIPLAWLGAVALPLRWVRLRRKGRAGGRPSGPHRAADPKADFVLCGLGLAALNGVLALYWGTRIEEGMFAFNSFFFYALLALPVVLCLGVLGEFVRAPLAVVAAGAAGAALVLGLVVQRQVLPQDSKIPAADSYALLQDLTRSAGEADPAKSPFVYLTFSHDQWDDAVILATHLSRHHIEWRVPAEWGFVFGMDHSLAIGDIAGLPRALRVSVQRDVPPPAIPSRPLPHGDYLALESHERARLDVARFPMHLVLDSAFFKQAVGLTGFDRNSDGAWGEGVFTDFPLELSPAGQDVIMTFDLEPLVHAPFLASQEFEVRLGQTLVGHYSLSQRQKVPIRIARSIWNGSRGASGNADLVFYWESAVAPLDIGYNFDRRPLAVAFHSAGFASSSAEGP
jgi:hypothetical protein